MAVMRDERHTVLCSETSPVQSAGLLEWKTPLLGRVWLPWRGYNTSETMVQRSAWRPVKMSLSLECQWTADSVMWTQGMRVCMWSKLQFGCSKLGLIKRWLFCLVPTTTTDQCGCYDVCVCVCAGWRVCWGTYHRTSLARSPMSTTILMILRRWFISIMMVRLVVGVTIIRPANFDCA